MATWIRICSVDEAPPAGEAIEVAAREMSLCLANSGGELCAIDNRCPHRGGPLAQGSIEGGSIVCPWHSWTFNLKTGVAESPVHDRVRAYAVRIENDDVFVQIE
jgi:nitrite reductase (NADH) small subunit